MGMKKALSGYSSTPLVKKLGIKAGQSLAVVNPPNNFLAQGLSTFA